MLTIIIELFSFLFWARAVYIDGLKNPCKVLTHNTNDYMHPDVLGCSEADPFCGIVDRTNLGCGEAEFKKKDWDKVNSVTMSTIISCDEVVKNYVIDYIVYASLGMVTGSCSELYDPYIAALNVKDEARPSWCIEEEFRNHEYTCCFGDDDDDLFINIPEEIGEECIGESKCEITVNIDGLSIDTGDELVEYTFSDSENAILRKIHGDWALKVLFQCAPDPYIPAEYSEYKFVVSIDDRDFREYSDIRVEITGRCWDTPGPDITTVNGEFNECVYSLFTFNVYSGDNKIGGTQMWSASNVQSCNKAYTGNLSVYPVHSSIPSDKYIHFSVTKTGGNC